MDVDALRALVLQLEWGADEAIDDAPLNRLPAPGEPSPLAKPAPASAPVSATKPVAAVPSQARAPAAQLARDAAQGAQDLAALAEAIRGFEACGLRDTASGPVLFEGDPGSGLLLVAGPPGADDDRAGRVMAGRAGAFLDAMLASIGLSRPALMLVPLIPWRPPGGRPPSPAELAICLPFLHRLVALTRPRLAVLLGPIASRALLGPERRGRGQIVPAEIPGLPAPLPCLPTLGPEELLRLPDRRPAAWAEWRRLRRAVEAFTHS